MKLRDISPGSEDQSVVIRILDSTAFTPEEGVEHDSDGISLWYRREGSTKQTINPAALASLSAAYTDGGIEHIDDGYYRLDVPDAAFAVGRDGVLIGGTVDGMIMEGVYVPLNLGSVFWDEILTGATHNIQNSAGKRLRQLQEADYQLASVWIDTVNGSPGVVAYENGIPSNPVNNMADALTIAAAVGLSSFQILNLSSITLAGSVAGFSFKAFGIWTLALGGQDCSNAVFEGASVSGICTGANPPIFQNCSINDVTLPPAYLRGCGLCATLTVGAAGDYFLDQCFSQVAGTATPTFDFGDGVGDTRVNFRHYSGGIQLERMGDAGTDTMSLEGFGQLVEGTCTGGIVAIRGNFTVSGITNLTLSDEARIDGPHIKAEVVEALTVDTYPEPGQGAPPVEASLADKISFPYKGWRNCWTQNKDTGEQILLGDDDVTPDQKAINSDDGTVFTRGKIGSGG